MAVDSKYVVFKREDWVSFCAGMGEDGVHCGGQAGIYITDLADRAVQDANVFRDQDVFTPTVLYSYASALRNAAEVLSTHGREDSALVISLNEQADAWMNAAERAEKAPTRKFPD